MSVDDLLRENDVMRRALQRIADRTSFSDRADFSATVDDRDARIALASSTLHRLADGNTASASVHGTGASA